MKVVGWRAWYTGGRRFNSRDHTWEQMPADGFLRAVIYTDVRHDNRLPKRRGLPGINVKTGAKYYFKADEVYGYNDDSPEEIMSRYGVRRESIKRGKWTTEQEEYDVRMEALKERFPVEWE